MEGWNLLSPGLNHYIECGRESLLTAIVTLLSKWLNISFFFFFPPQVDHSRRTHDYDPFIRTFLTMLAEQGHFAQLVEQQTSLKRRLSQTKPHLKQLKRVYKRKKSRWTLFGNCKTVCEGRRSGLLDSLYSTVVPWRPPDDGWLQETCSEKERNQCSS